MLPPRSGCFPHIVLLSLASFLQLAAEMEGICFDNSVSCLKRKLLQYVPRFLFCIPNPPYPLCDLGQSLRLTYSGELLGCLVEVTCAVSYELHEYSSNAVTMRVLQPYTLTCDTHIRVLLHLCGFLIGDDTTFLGQTVHSQKEVN